MKINRKNLNLYAVCVILLLGWTANAQTLPDKDEVYSKMKLVNDYWINTHPDPGNNKWQRAAYMVGNIHMYHLRKEQAYYNYILRWAIQNNWALNGGPTTRAADNHSAGSTYIDLYKIEPADYKIQDITTAISGMVNSSKLDDWHWVDSQFMSMPAFTKLGVLYNDTRYFDKLYDLYHDSKTRRMLYDTTSHLWYRDGAYIYPEFTTPSGKKCFWSRGNGWVFAAHARVLDILPTSDPHYEEYLTTFKDMAAALKAVQRTDGFWNVSLHDPDDYPGPETSGTGFFTFGLAWGINKGHLDRATYEPVVARAWNGLVNIAVRSDGYVGYIQSVGKDPTDGQPITSNSNSDFGVGALLIAGSEVYKLSESTSIPVPTAPTGLVANVVSSSQIDLMWTDSSNNETGFRIEQKTSTTDYIEIASVEANATRYSHTGLPANMTYTYRIVAFNSSGNSEYSNEISATTFTDTPVEVELPILELTASSNISNNVLDNTIDEDPSTYWAASGRNQWILYDLGAIKTVTQVQVAWHTTRYRIYPFRIQVSNDGVTFTNVASGVVFRSTSLRSYDFSDIQARYIRILGPNRYIGIREAEIYGMN
jgi:unsaturated rhamnogalacturonyl hydrolase